MTSTAIFSALAANRKSFFELVAAAERECNCKLDEIDVMAVIDSEFAGMESLTAEQAQRILMAASQPK